jgi:hypothetical protein
MKKSVFRTIVRNLINESLDNDGFEKIIEIYQLYKKGEVDKRTFYSFLGSLTREEKEKLLDYIKNN